MPTGMVYGKMARSIGGTLVFSNGSKKLIWRARIVWR